MINSKRDLYRRVIEEVGLLLDDQGPDAGADDISDAARRLILMFWHQGWATDVDLMVIDALRSIADVASTQTLH